jgi:HEPN domain-containing protein
MADQHDLAEELLARASDDEAAVRALLDVESITDSIVGFHAQQAVEKALKSVLASRGVEFPFIHDLAALMELSDAAGAAVGSRTLQCPALDRVRGAVAVWVRGGRRCHARRGGHVGSRGDRMGTRLG